MLEDMIKMGAHLKDQRAYQKMLQDPLAGQRGTLPSALELATVFGCGDDEKENYVKLWRNYSNMERMGNVVSFLVQPFGSLAGLRKEEKARRDQMSLPVSEALSLSL